MMPRLLTDWTKDQLTELLDKGIFEPESFDFKEFRITKKTDPEKRDIRKDCCAFANSFGGFLVYGVGDDRRLPAKDRLVGVDKNFDFPKEFGAFPKECKPSIAWEFLNPPIDLGNGKAIHVVFIPRSWRGPHCVQADKPQEGFVFPKRTNKGNEYMNYEEVTMAFLGYYEKRLKLQLLRSELISLQETAAGACIRDESQIASHYSLETFDTRVIESVVADTYSITCGHLELLALLTRIRKVTRIANNKIRIFFGTVQLPLTNQPQEIRGHNQFMHPRCEEIMDLCGKAVVELEAILGKT